MWKGHFKKVLERWQQGGFFPLLVIATTYTNVTGIN